LPSKVIITDAINLADYVVSLITFYTYGDETTTVIVW